MWEAADLLLVTLYLDTPLLKRHFWFWNNFKWLYSEHYIGFIIPIMLKNHSKYLKVNPGFLREKLQNIYNVMHFLDVLTFSKCLRNRQSIISRRRLNHLNIEERINLWIFDMIVQYSWKQKDGFEKYDVEITKLNIRFIRIRIYFLWQSLKT